MSKINRVEIRDCMFQFATDFRVTVKIYEDTDLITREKALELWEKWKPQALKDINDGGKVDMVIWTGCKSYTDYHTVDEEYSWEQREYE